MNRTRIIVLIVASGACLWLAARQQGALLEMRREYRLNQAEPLEDSPPLVSFTMVALGGFRGVVADIMWLRASALQEEKKFFELVQLADWITKLEPREPDVWAYQAWNMAYNVSVMLDDPADRWRWVKHGVELLRDRGLYYNPGESRLYAELGWLFQHKMGAFLDQAHLYYKRMWADEMMQLFDGLAPNYRVVLANPNDPRTQRTIQEYKLLPEVMRKVDEEYGPLDWRLPQAHAIYWAYRGRSYARGFEQLRLDRMIFQSMQESFREGYLVYNAQEKEFSTEPNFLILDKVCATYETAIAQHPDEDSVQSAYRNFLGSAVLVFYTFQFTEPAQRLYDKLRELTPRESRPTQDLATFAYHKLTEGFGTQSPAEATATVEGLFFQGYRWLAIGEEERAAGLMALAHLSYKKCSERLAGPQYGEGMRIPPEEQLRQRALRRAMESLQGESARRRLQPLLLGPAP